MYITDDKFTNYLIMNPYRLLCNWEVYKPLAHIIKICAEFCDL